MTRRQCYLHQLQLTYWAMSELSMYAREHGLEARGPEEDDGERMNDTWTTWAFQSNFMFDPVL